MADFAFRSSSDTRRAKSERAVQDKALNKKMRGDVESKVVDEQVRKISNRFGPKAADSANYGWGSSGDRDFASVATKVYHPKGARVLLSEASRGDEGATHSWRKYGK